MLLATFLSLAVVPVFFVLIERIRERFAGAAGYGAGGDCGAGAASATLTATFMPGAQLAQVVDGDLLARLRAPSRSRASCP